MNVNYKKGGFDVRFTVNERKKFREVQDMVDFCCRIEDTVMASDAAELQEALHKFQHYLAPVVKDQPVEETATF